MSVSRTDYRTYTCNYIIITLSEYVKVLVVITIRIVSSYLEICPARNLTSYIKHFPIGASDKFLLWRQNFNTGTFLWCPVTMCNGGQVAIRCMVPWSLKRTLYCSIMVPGFIQNYNNKTEGIHIILELYTHIYKAWYWFWSVKQQTPPWPLALNYCFLTWYRYIQNVTRLN